MSTTHTSVWYREPWAVFAFAIPAATIVAGIITIWIAANGADTRVSDSVNRFGIQQPSSQQAP